MYGFASRRGLVVGGNRYIGPDLVFELARRLQGARREGRDRFELDFSGDDAILAELIDR